MQRKILTGLTLLALGLGALTGCGGTSGGTGEGGAGGGQTNPNGTAEVLPDATAEGGGLVDPDGSNQGVPGEVEEEGEATATTTP
jgi:hypothetical protein